MKSETFYKIVLFGALYTLFLVLILQYQRTELTDKHINNLLTYCENVTGEKKASFLDNGQFNGCNTDTSWTKQANDLQNNN